MPYTLNILLEIFHGQGNKITLQLIHFSPVSEEDIDRFLGFNREEFPRMSITSKLHMLEDHDCSLLRKWHMGLGFYCEQGVEGIHSELNLQAEHFDHVKKEEVRLLHQIMSTIT